MSGWLRGAGKTSHNIGMEFEPLTRGLGRDKSLIRNYRYAALSSFKVLPTGRRARCRFSSR